MGAKTIEEALRYKLRACTALTTLIGANKVFYIDAPQGTVAPYVTFNLIADDRAPYKLCKDNAGQPSIQIDVWARDSVQTLNISNAIITELNFFKGFIDSLQVDWIRCHGVQVSRDDASDDLYHGIVETDLLYIIP
jgi:hypothetical protein